MKQSLKNPSILITGGTGYVGTHVTVELQKAGYDITIIDRLSNSNIEVIHAIKEISGVAPQFFETDVLEKEALEEVFENSHFDAVIHLAGLKAVGDSIKDPGTYYRENFTGLLNVLDAMRKTNVENFVYSSSATVYGASHSSPYSETQPIGLAVTNPYGQTKAIGEQILKDYSLYEERPIKSIALRYFNPIGSHESGLIGENPIGVPGNLMPYILQVASGRRKSLQVFGGDYPTADGTCERDYVHIVDVARAYLSTLEALLSPLNNKTLQFAYNVGNGSPTSVLKLLQKFENANGVKVPYTIEPRRPGDLASFCADATAIARDLNWSPELSLEDACKDGWRYQSRLMGIN